MCVCVCGGGGGGGGGGVRFGWCMTEKLGRGLTARLCVCMCV